MKLITFNRPTGKWKAPAWGFEFDASGSAWGDGGPNAPYGHDCQIAPGHYQLTRVERFDPIPSEGAAQIYVADLTETDVDQLVAVNEAIRSGSDVTINGITLPMGGLARYGRDGVMNHGGGTNLGVPECYAAFQALCRTYGCTRLHNADLARACDAIEPCIGKEHVIFTVVGDSPALAQ